MQERSGASASRTFTSVLCGPLCHKMQVAAVSDSDFCSQLHVDFQALRYGGGHLSRAEVTPNPSCCRTGKVRLSQRACKISHYTSVKGRKFGTPEDNGNETAFVFLAAPDPPKRAPEQTLAAVCLAISTCEPTPVSSSTGEDEMRNIFPDIVQFQVVPTSWLHCLLRN